MLCCFSDCFILEHYLQRVSDEYNDTNIQSHNSQWVKNALENLIRAEHEKVKKALEYQSQIESNSIKQTKTQPININTTKESSALKELKPMIAT